jgi:hypothetical protein
MRRPNFNVVNAMSYGLHETSYVCIIYIYYTLDSDIWYPRNPGKDENMSDSAHETSSDTGITQRHILSSNSIRRSASIATISFSRLKRDGKISQDQTDVNVLERPSTPIADKYIGLLSMPSSKGNSVYF